MEALLKERREQLEATRQADVDRLKGEHEKNLKNLALEFQDKVYIVFLHFVICCCSLSTLLRLIMHFVNYIILLIDFLLNLFDFLVIFVSVASVFQEQQQVQDLQQQFELEMSRLQQEHERVIDVLTRELKNAEHQLEQQLQRKVCLVYNHLL